MTEIDDDRNIMELSKEEILEMDLDEQLKFEIMIQWEIIHKTICAKCSHRGDFDGRMYHCYKSEVDDTFEVQCGNLTDKDGKILGGYVRTCPLFDKEAD